MEISARSSTYKSTALSSGRVEVKLRPKSIRTYREILIDHMQVDNNFSHGNHDQDGKYSVTPTKIKTRKRGTHKLIGTTPE
jgi:hypothetical protein